MIKGLVSIIIPIYNVEKYLSECLYSVINQTYANIEILLINDGSTDQSGAICDEFAQQDSRIKVFHKKNEGVSKTRNFGLDHAMGEFISFVDGDDTIESQFIEMMYTEMIEGDYEIVRLAWTRGHLDKTYNVTFDNFGKKLITISNFDDLSLCANIWGLFRLETLSNIRFDESLTYAEDNLFIVEVFVKSRRKTMLLINKPFYHYREVGDSASTISPVKCAILSNLFISKISSMEPLLPRLTFLEKKYKGKDYLSLMYYLVKHKKKSEGPFSLNEVRKIVCALKSDGAIILGIKGMIKFFVYKYKSYLI